MSGAVPPPQPPSDPNQPPGYSGGAGPNDPGAYTGPPSGSGGTGPTGVSAPAGSDDYQPPSSQVGAYPTSSGYGDTGVPQTPQDPHAARGDENRAGYSEPVPVNAQYGQTSSSAARQSSVSSSPAKSAAKDASPLDWAIIGAGLLAFLLSLFTGYYTYTTTLEGDDETLLEEVSNNLDLTDSMNAWHGVFGWLAALLALAGAAIVLLGVLGILKKMRIVQLGAVGAFGLATLCALVALLVVPGNDDDVSLPGGATFKIDPGHGLTYWLSLALILLGLALSVARMRSKD